MEPEFLNNFLKGKENDFSAGYETGCPFLFLPALNSLFSDFKPITAMIMVKTEMERSLTIQIYLNQSHSYIKDVKLGLGNPEFMHTMNLFLSMLIFFWVTLIFHSLRLKIELKFIFLVIQQPVEYLIQTLQSSLVMFRWSWDFYHGRVD